jgi:oligopeptide transport system substrate-binding protein
MAKLAEAGGFKGGKITLSYNADASHKGWTEATCNSIKSALGVDCVATPVVDFSTFRTQIANRKMKGMFRTGWQMDYPSIENFLAPIFKTGASSNDGDYSNPAFDKLLVEAAAATDPAEANKKYQEAEALLADNMPAIPMWYSTATMGWSDKVTGVKITAFGTIDFSSISVK